MRTGLRRARPARRPRPAPRRSRTSRPRPAVYGAIRPARGRVSSREHRILSGEGVRMRTNLARATFALALLAVVGIGSYAMADSGKKNLKADELVGYQENPDISTVANGSFEVSI